MLGLNKRISLISVNRAISDSGAVDSEVEVVVLAGVPAAIQPHLLNNLPPPGERNAQGGLLYIKEHRCWIPTSAIAGIIPRTTWLVRDEVTSEMYRIRAVVDDGGRSHHWLLRLENYDG